MIPPALPPIAAAHHHAFPATPRRGRYLWCGGWSIMTQMQDVTGSGHEGLPWLAATPIAYALILQLGAAWDFAVAMHELVDLAEEHARAEEIPAADIADSSPAASQVPVPLRERIKEMFEQVEQDQAAALAGVREEDLDVNAFEADPVAAVMDILRPQEAFSAVTARMAGLLAEITQSPAAMAYAQAFMQAMIRRPRRPLVYPAILAAICSNAEATVAGTLRRLLYEAGGYSSVLDPALDEKVHEIIGGGGALGKWAAELRKHFVNLEDLTIDWPGYLELFARRNLFLHRHGRVDQRYADRVPDSPAIGSVIDLDTGYLREAIDRCEFLAVAMLSALLVNTAPAGRQQVAGFANERAETAAGAGAFARAESYHHLAGILSGDQLYREQQRVNSWLDRAARLGIDAVRADVQEWEVDGLPPQFRLARHVLLGEDDQGLAMFRQLRAEGILTQQDAEQWRLFARWRDEHRI